MPLHLTVSLVDDDSPSSSRTTRRQNCFVRLPVDVASSLNSLEPFAPLVVLRLHIARERDSKYVAWDGGTTNASGTLGIDERFGRVLSLCPGDTVTVTVAERIHNTPAYPLRNAVVRPASYDSTEISSTSTERLSADYASLSAAAETLQRTLLADIRVLHVGLIFPLSMPGYDVVILRVVSIDVDGLTQAPYAVLRPDSQIEVESPPLPRSSAQDPASVSVSRRFARVIALSTNAVTDLSETVLKTHALLPPVALKGENPQTCITVSRKRRANGEQFVAAVSVATVLHPAVRPHCVALPPAVWHRLRLTPLTPVLIENAPMPFMAPKNLRLVPIVDKHRHHFPTFSDLQTCNALFFHGMFLRDGVLLTEQRVNAVEVLPPDQFSEPWSDPSLEKPEDSEMIYVDLLDDPLFQESHEKELIIASSARQILPAFQATRQLQVRKDTESPLAVHLRTHFRSVDADEYPWFEENFRQSLLSRITPSMKVEVNKLLKATRQSLQFRIKAKNKDDLGRLKCFAIAVEGSSGSGKSFLSATIAAVLRDAGLLRTIWLQGRLLGDEDLNLRLRRLEKAFEAASDEGPGIVILDDFDTFCGRSTHEQDPHQIHENKEKEEDEEVISGWIDALIQHRRKNTVIFLVSCEQFDELPEDLRAPGTIIHFTSLKAPNVNDRAFMFMCEMRDLISSSGPGNGEHDNLRLAELALSLGAASEGYCARDVMLSITRAKLRLMQIGNQGTLVELIPLYEALMQIIKTMVPINQIGIDVHEEADEERLSWERVGGASTVKSAIYEALELPTKHRDIFRNVPIRLPHGLLLLGPPGCGKTMIARTAAVESGMRCVLVKGAELMGKYIGQSEAEVRRAFERASACAPCVLLFDEFDALAPSRGGWDAGVTDRVVNTLLTCMDGVERVAEGVYIIATSSRPEVIDAALLRPGRLDRWIVIDLPSDSSDRMDILICHARDSFQITPGIKTALNNIALETNGYTGADLQSIINEANINILDATTPSSVDDKGSDQDTSVNKEKGEKEQEIINALFKAHRNSRPSLSATQRAHYARVMANFTKDEDRGTRSDRSNMETNTQYGKRLALK